MKIDKNAVLEILHNHEPFMDDLAHIEITRLINALPASEDEWVSVDTAMPNNPKPILGICNNGFPVIAYYSDGNSLIAYNEDEEPMPMPKGYYTSEKSANPDFDNVYEDVFIKKWKTITTH